MDDDLKTPIRGEEEEHRAFSNALWSRDFAARRLRVAKEEAMRKELARLGIMCPSYDLPQYCRPKGPVKGAAKLPTQEEQQGLPSLAGDPSRELERLPRLALLAEQLRLPT